MARKDLVRWTKKNDPEAYGFWKRDLRPALGKSVKRTNEAIRVLKVCAESPFHGLRCEHEAIEKITREMEKYQSYLGASITFGYLYNLSRDHKRKIRRQRRGPST